MNWVNPEFIPGNGRQMVNVNILTFLFFNYVLKHIIFQTFKVCDNNKLQKSESKTT